MEASSVAEKRRGEERSGRIESGVEVRLAIGGWRLAVGEEKRRRSDFSIIGEMLNELVIIYFRISSQSLVNLEYLVNFQRESESHLASCSVAGRRGQELFSIYLRMRSLGAGRRRIYFDNCIFSSY